MKIDQSRKTRTKALLCVRWDEILYKDKNEDVESWLEVIPKYYGMDGKTGWEMVPRRERPVDEVALADEVADLESSDDDDDEIESASDSSSSSDSDSDSDESQGQGQEEPQKAISKRPRS